jgi:hypothetical protein
MGHGGPRWSPNLGVGHAVLRELQADGQGSVRSRVRAGVSQSVLLLVRGPGAANQFENATRVGGYDPEGPGTQAKRSKVVLDIIVLNSYFFSPAALRRQRLRTGH